MKISAITPYSQNQNYKINTKGKLSGDAQLMIEDICYSCVDRFSKAPENSIKKAFFDEYAERSKNLIENIKTIMQRFPKSAILDFASSKKGFHRLFIHSSESDYKYIVGDVKPENRIKDVETLEEMTENLAKVNPYETSFKFKMLKHENAEDSFAPEKDIIIIEDVMAKKKSNSEVLEEDIKKFAKTHEQY